MPRITGVEDDDDLIGNDSSALLASILFNIISLHAHGETAVIYTSRVERSFASQEERLAFGMAVSDFLMEIVKKLPATLGFLISKGGITSNDVLSTGLALRTSRVLGQILPGCSVVRCPATHARYPDMPVVIFPGNVGDKNSLAKAYDFLALQDNGSEAGVMTSVG